MKKIKAIDTRSDWQRMMDDLDAYLKNEPNVGIMANYRQSILNVIDYRMKVLKRKYHV